MVDFVELLSTDDVAGCQQTIRALVTTLPKDIISWEEALISMAEAIANYGHQQTLTVLLEELPEDLLEAFYIRLLNAKTLAPEIIFGLTQFIISKQNLRDENSINLVRLLLFSPYSIEENQLIKLTERLDEQCIAKLLLELRQYALQKNIDLDRKNTDPKNSRSGKDSYQLKYQIFLTGLTLDANSSIFKLPIVIQNNPFLANLIIIKRISCAKKEQFKKIIDELIVHGQCYDWQELRFKQVVLPVFNEVLVRSSQEETNRLLGRYGQLTHSGHPGNEDKVRLLDQFYFDSNSLDRLLSCIQTLVHQDANFIINYLTLTRINNSEVRENLLAQICEEAYPGIMGHIYVLGKMSLEQHEHSGIFEEYISVFCQKLKAVKKNELMNSFAEQYQHLPEAAQLQLMKKMHNQLSDSPLLQTQWLLKVKERQADAAILWPFYNELLRAFPNRNEISQPLLKALSSEELLKLYVYLVNQKTPFEIYCCLQTLFSTIDRHPQMFYLMTNTPAIPQQLLSGFVDNLDDRTLITLLDILLEKKLVNSEYTNTLNQVMLKFCQRLFLFADKEHAIHQWTGEHFTANLVVHLLENPECVYELSLRSSRLWHWITWSSTPQALKLRIDRVLNETRLDDEDIQRVALNWLSHFRLQPEKLTLIFSHLEQSAENRNVIGNDNYFRIKKGCWDILGCVGDYTDNAFQKICLKFRDKNTFDTMLHKQAAEQHLLNPSQGARLLALTQLPLPDNFSNPLMLSLLVHSVHEDCLSNWKKVSQRLEHQTQSVNISFFKALMDHVLRAEFNPVLVEKAHELITHSPFFDELIKQCTEQDVLWLMQYSSVDVLKESFFDWFDLLIQQHAAQRFNFGLLLSHLPEDDCLLNRVFSHQSLESPDNAARLFIQLAGSDHSERLLVGLHKKMIGHPASWIKDFLMKVQLALKAQQINIMAAHVLNVFILTVSDSLQAADPEHQALYKLQFEWLNTLFKNKEAYQKECLQLILNLLTQFSRLDRHWAQISFQSEPMVQSLIHCFQLMNLPQRSNSLHQHPLTALFLDNLTLPLNDRLKSHPKFQAFVGNLIEYPSEFINIELYLILFDLLDASHQHNLVKVIAETQNRHPVHTTILPIIAAGLDVRTLYEIFVQQPDDFLVVETIFSHPEGLEKLTPAQRFQLISLIKSSEQLLKILNGFNRSENRKAFVTCLYESINYDWQRLAEKFSNWGLNKESLASIANYTILESQQLVLRHLLSNKIFYEQYLEDYIRHPKIHLPLEADSYLKKMLQQRLLAPGPGQEFDVSFLTYFTPHLIFENLKYQFHTILQWDAMAKTLEPLLDCDTVLNDALSAARWFHQLPLYSDGIAFILAHYFNSNNNIQQIIAQTELFTAVIQPLCLGEHGSNLMSLPSRLPGLLEEYAVKLNEWQPDHSQWIRQTGLLYQEKLTAMASFSPPGIHDFFKPDSVFTSKIAEKKLSSRDSGILTVRPDRTALKDRQSAFKKALKIAFQKTDVMTDKTIHGWLFTKVFLSPLSHFIDNELLRQYFQCLSPKVWTAKLHSFHDKYHQLLQGFDDLALLAQFNSFDEVIEYLETFDEKKINELSKLARTLNMTHVADFMGLFFYARLTRLSVKRMIYQLLPLSDNMDLGVEWLGCEVRDIEGYKLFLASRYEDLVTQGFQCDVNSVDFSDRLSALKVACSSYLSPELLVKCLNSYRVVFSNKQGLRGEFLKAFSEILKAADHALFIINAMHGDVTRAIIEDMMNDPVHHQDVLHLMLNSNYQQFCQQQLEQRFFTLLDLENTAEGEPLYSVVIEKSSRDLSLSTAVVLQLTALYRLLAIANPQGEFANLKEMNFLSGQPYKKQSFIADVCTWQWLENMHAKQPESKAWLQKQCHDSAFPYKGSLDAVLGSKPDKYPLAYYHWMLWRSQLDPEPSYFIDGFLNWLNALDESQLIDNPKLIHLLQDLTDKGLLSQLCQRVVEADCLKRFQLTWLSNAMVCLDRFRPDYLMDIIKICTAEGLEKMMPLISKQALTSLSPEEIMGLLKRFDENSLKAMLVTHLLGREDFIRRLNGVSFIKQLSKQTLVFPRLQPFLFQLHVHLLTPEIIAGLTEEAAASCLFSVQHFHQWSKEQVQALLGRYPADAVVNQWVCHFSMMPNATFMIAHLFRQADSKIFNAMDKKMHPLEKKPLLSRLIRDLELFDFLKSGFVERSDESHLIEAIERYNEGHPSAIRLAFIKALLKRLLTEGHHFSDKAIHSLFSLQDKEEFIELNYKLAALYNRYLRCSAVSSNIDIFYQNGSFSFSRTKIIMTLQAQVPKEKIQAAFQPSLQQLLLQSESQQLPDENQVINALIKFNKPVKAIDYFLMHYQGKQEQLNQLLNDYFGRFQWTSPRGFKPLYSTSILMRRKEIPEQVRKAIFSAFTRHPLLSDETITQNLFLFDANAMVKEYGLAKKYQPLIDICTLILENKSLKPPVGEETGKIMIKAMDDARFELRMSEMSGIFLNLRRWFYRCRYYGWKGLFVPLDSQYVAAFDSKSPPPEIHKTPEYLNPCLTAVEALKKALETGNYLNIHEALGRYKNSIADEEELSLRQAVDTTYQSLLRDASENPQVKTWLEKNQSAFLDNRQRILECLLKNDKLVEMRQCLELYARGPGDFTKISQQFIFDNNLLLLPATADEPEPDITTMVQADLKAVADTAVDSVFKLAEYVGTWFWRLPQTRLIEQGTAESSASTQQNQVFPSRDR